MRLIPACRFFVLLDLGLLLSVGSSEPHGTSGGIGAARGLFTAAATNGTVAAAVSAARASGADARLTNGSSIAAA